MADNVSPEKRSKIMRSIKGSGTRPEMAVRKLVRDIGRGYRLRRPSLPGRPDLIFPGMRKAIFVNGCFWHAHFFEASCRIARNPGGEKWQRKLAENRERDARSIRLLEQAGWASLVIWECELAKPDLVRQRLMTFLGTLDTEPPTTVRCD
ncbi:hypothetical protein BKK79_10505 [Cupriavidus sp. USMAA2-4]|uniref:very short patch repair endonuclease n=1 Tax=Cupriavidus sp. USMAA2-4 TaxID=876364 RepID=UPI0008A66B12|nr:hypothetical protein BKK79_10505 [Cupriavidus sp. USMAA2-4]